MESMKMLKKRPKKKRLVVKRTGDDVGRLVNNTTTGANKCAKQTAGAGQCVPVAVYCLPVASSLRRFHLFLFFGYCVCVVVVG